MQIHAKYTLAQGLNLKKLNGLKICTMSSIEYIVSAIKVLER